MAKKIIKKTDDSDVARKIWLAGVGAYGRAFNEAQERIEKLADDAGEMFEELVARGEKIEDDVRKRIGKSDTASKVTEFVDQARKFQKFQRADIEDRVAAVRKTIGETFSAPANLLNIGRTLDKLSKKVDALATDVAGLKTGKTKGSTKAKPRTTRKAA